MQTETTEPEAGKGSTRDTVPYFAFRTLQNTLEDMKKRAIPNRIDRSFLTGMSGAGQTQFIAGLRGLGLIDASGNVQPRLRDMVNADSKERQRLLGEVLRETYPEAVELGKTNATTGELVEVFRTHYGVSGDTARKAIAFYLQAAKFAGDVPVSQLFQTPKVTSSGTSTRKRKKPDESNGAGAEQHPPSNETPSGIPMPEFHPTLAGVLMEFPTRGGGWTKARRDKTMSMFEMAVDFTIPILDEESDADEEDQFEDETADELGED
ncbi:MAG: DUF5343 domain-containing protein [Gaiellaceae bacterium]